MAVPRRLPVVVEVFETDDGKLHRTGQAAASHDLSRAVGVIEMAVESGHFRMAIDSWPGSGVVEALRYIVANAPALAKGGV